MLPNQHMYEKGTEIYLPAAGKIVLKGYLMAGIVPDKFWQISYLFIPVQIIAKSSSVDAKLNMEYKNLLTVF